MTDDEDEIIVPPQEPDEEAKPLIEQEKQPKPDITEEEYIVRQKPEE